MSFTFNKETRRSLRERIRDGVNLIPGASTVVQASGNIVNTATGALGVGGTDKKGVPIQPGNFQKKSHSVDSNSLIQLQEPEESILTATTRPQQQPPISPSYLSAENNPSGDQHDTPSRSGSVSSCSSSTSSSPSKYRTYVVKSNDTVTSIAAQMDCTPSELMRVNRLITARVLFPGQVLKIPNKRSDKPLPNQQNAAPTEVPPPPATDPATATILESITYAQRKFLKVKVRHVTDGNGVVSGTLLITPNAVMFDPNVSDPLVIEQGAETYGVIVPIEFIVGASIWSDICGMKVRGKEAFIAPGPRPLLWGVEKQKSQEKPEAKEPGDKGQTKEDEVEGNKKEGEEKSSADGSETEPMKTEDESSSSPASRLEEVTDHPLKEPENIVSTWYFCLTIGRPKPSEDHANDHKAARRNPYCVTYGQKNTVRPEFWFSVGIEQVPELYKYWMFWWPHLYGEVNLATVAERGYEVIDWDNLDVSLEGVAGAAGGRSQADGGSEEQTVAQELNELTKESWEMLKQPYAKLSSFITTRGSSIMKSSSHSSQSSVSDALVGQHSSSHHHHTQQSTSSSLFNSHHFSITNPMNSFFFESFSNISPNHSVFDDTDDDDDEFGSFEQVVTSEELRNLLAMGGEEMMALNLPELIGGKSEILEEEDVRNITRHLTARAEGYPWTLIFTSSRDGFSLNSLYRRNSLMQEDSPVMLLIQDTNSRVFGALVSCSLHTSDSFYGTGQSFLCTLRPEFNIYKWTGENLFFVKGNHDGIWIGAGDGKFGLYVDGDLNCGRTETCQTYGNPPLTDPQDFIIKTLECWAFGNYVLSSGNDLIDRASTSDK